MSEPFSRVIRVDAIPIEGRTVTLEATPEERRALAKLYQLPSIDALTTSLSLAHASGGAVRVTGAVHGELTQICVVSLDPFPATIDEAIDVRFAPREIAEDRARPETLVFSMSDEDEPDPIVDGKIDLGALAAEFFALGIDPYPRKPGVIFDTPVDRSDPVTPFAVLRDFGKGQK